MAKKNIKKATKQLATETAAKRPTASAGMALQTLTPVAESKPNQSPAQHVQDAPAKAVAARGSLTTAAQSPKPAAQPEPVKSREKVAVVAEAPLVSKVPTVKVTFVLPTCPCCAKRVSLSGDFNGWSPDATPMKRYDDGHWETTLELAPGRYEYKFVRDGEWMPDLLARENVLNGYGTLNSVIEVRSDNR
jgi:hypothetical protein